VALNEIGPFDSSLHMFVNEPRSPDMERLRFMRWLVENDHFGRPAYGPASGELTGETGEDVEDAS
jgi:hypothetical protein